jgi:long-chain alkane monooxygenase
MPRGCPRRKTRSKASSRYRGVVVLADEMEHYMDDGGAEGFMLIATYTPGCFEEFVDLVVPELQRRGRFRTQYNGTTLRENLLEQ